MDIVAVGSAFMAVVNGIGMILMYLRYQYFAKFLKG